jgi:hypothetical protein
MNRSSWVSGNCRLVRPARFERATYRFVVIWLLQSDRLPRARNQRQPFMQAAVNVKQLPETAPWLPTTTMPSSSSPLLDQTRGLENPFHQGVRHLKPVVSTRNLVEMTAIEAAVKVSIEIHHSPNLIRLHSPRRRLTPTPVEQPPFPVPVHAPSPPTDRPWAQVQDLRRLQPGVLTRNRPHNHVPHPHRSLHSLLREEHRGLLATTLPFPQVAQKERSDHLLSGAVRSCAPYSSVRLA